MSQLDVPVNDVMDAIKRDHQRLDELFSKASHLIAANNTAKAAPIVLSFAEGLRRHMQVERDILANTITPACNHYINDPTCAMLREHEDILTQTLMIESRFENGTPTADEVAPLLATLADTLAKHEAREESSLFPQWEAAIHMAVPEAQATMLRKAQNILAGVAE
jgi:iron-sulfur cluster repair protein YtfE (RIC family)